MFFIYIVSFVIYIIIHTEFLHKFQRILIRFFYLVGAELHNFHRRTDIHTQYMYVHR